jgi:hypothetical protein
MRQLRRVVGMFLAILVTLIGLAKTYETIMQTFVANYDDAFHQYSVDLHFGLALVAAGLTGIWWLRRKDATPL